MPTSRSFGPVTLDRLACALAEDHTWGRVDRILEALIEQRAEVPFALAQCSLWYLPEAEPAQMQRIRGHYIVRPPSHPLDPKHLSVMFAANMIEWADPGVQMLHKRLAESPDHEVRGDYGSIVTPEIWRELTIFKKGHQPAGFETGYTDYWRVDAQHVVNATLWSGEVRHGPSETQREQIDALMDLAKPLFEKALIGDAVGQTVRALTERQRDVLRLMLAGYSEKQMAERLHRSINTVHTHVGELHRQFGVQSRAELMSLFTEEDLVDRHTEGGWA